MCLFMLPGAIAKTSVVHMSASVHCFDNTLSSVLDMVCPFGGIPDVQYSYLTYLLLIRPTLRGEGNLNLVIAYP